jgi:serine protease Do
VLYVGKVLSQDADRDLALLSTNARSCTFLPLGDSKNAAIGNEIYAIGNPLGLSGTVTRGIISGLRSRSSGVSYIQIDASINPGNSGGPLLNQTGHVVGVTTFKVSGFEGLNFAVASNEIGNAFGRFLAR